MAQASWEKILDCNRCHCDTTVNAFLEQYAVEIVGYEYLVFD